MIDTIIHGDSAEVLKTFTESSIELTVTSPPYDFIYSNDQYKVIFDFETIANELYRVTNDGGIVAWVVNDQYIQLHENGSSRSGTSFKQALYFMDIGFNLHDCIIYEKAGGPYPSSNRYTQSYEFVFILSKGKPKTTNIIKDKYNRWYGTTNWGTRTMRQHDGTLAVRNDVQVNKYGSRTNIWRYSAGKGYLTPDDRAHEHPAIMPMKLAEDLILSFSDESSTVLDPFSGSGTTAIAAQKHNRHYIGIEISEQYVQLSKQLISDAVLQPTLL